MRRGTEMRRHGEDAGAWQVVLSAVLLSAAVAAAAAAATVRLAAPEAPGIASVRLGEMTASWTARAASEGKTAEDARAWGSALEAALKHVAERHGVVLLPARAVAAGAPDLTREVEATLGAILAYRGAAPSAPGAGDAR